MDSTRLLLVIVYNVPIISNVFYALQEPEQLWEVCKLSYFHWLGKWSVSPELVSQAGVSLAVQKGAS